MPTMNFTSRGIDALKPTEGKQIDYFDEKVKGLCLRVSGTGRKTWTLLYKFRGLSRRFTIGTYPVFQLADARKKANELLLEIATGTDPAGEKRAYKNSMTVRELVEHYMETHSKPKKRSWKNDQRYADKELVPRIGNMKCCDVRKSDIYTILDRILTRGPVAANRTFQFIRALFNFAVQRGIISISPCYMMKAPAPETSRDRVLTNEEIAAIWEAIAFEEQQSSRPWKYLITAYFKLFVLLGQRGYEIRTMRWIDLDLDGGWWTIPAERSKNKRPHRVPLGRLSIEILKILQQKATSTWVFPSPRRQKWDVESKVGYFNNVGKATGRIRTRSGVSDFVNHDFRRTVTTHLAELGVAESLLERILNHSEPKATRKVTLRYNRYLYEKEKKAALGLWEEHVAKVTSGEGASPTTAGGLTSSAVPQAHPDSWVSPGPAASSTCQ